MSGLFWIVAGLGALGLGVYLGLPRVEGGPAWKRGTRALHAAPKSPFALRKPRTPSDRRHPEASDEAREQTAARKTFLRRRINPLDLLRLDERGSARRRARQPFRMSASAGSPSHSDETPSHAPAGTPSLATPEENVAPAVSKASSPALSPKSGSRPPARDR